MVKHLNVRSSAKKLRRELAGSDRKNRWETLHDVSISNSFVDKTAKTQAARTKIDKWDSIKTRSSCTAKETIDTLKRQPAESGKICANCSSDKN